MDAGANQMHGISFRIEGAESLLNDARKRAMADARAKAELLAGEAGMVVGHPITIREEGTPTASKPMMVGFRAAAMTPNVPVSPGEQELAVSVYVVYELKTPK